jgi:arylsulfatase A-like enzyme
MTAAQRKPNIVVICADQHRADSLGAYGNRVCRTPALDRLAQQGTLFERCFVQNPVCMPQRASLMTGCLSRNTGVRTNGIPLRTDLPTLASVLQQAGYRTGAVGKLHLKNQSEGVAQAPHYGFQQVANVEDSRVGPYLDWALAHFPEYEGYLIGTLFNLPTNERYWEGRRDFRREYLQARERYVKPLEISATCNWGFGHYSPLPEQAHHNVWIADRVIDYLQQTPAAEPFFLWVGFVHPHNPCDPPRRFRELYPPDAVEPRIHRDGEEALWPPHHRAAHRYYGRFTASDWRILRALYYGCVTFMDQEIGRILAAMEQRFDMRHTIVLFTADHGEILGDHGLCGKSAYHYDSCIRVPLIGRWDGQWAAGRRERTLVESTDLMPTLLAAAGSEEPPVMDGRSFLPLLAGAPYPDARGHAFAESYAGAPEDPSPMPVTWARTIRTDRWRATFYPNADYGELFDLDNDPREVFNVWFRPESRPVIEEHRRLLLDRLILADFPLRNWHGRTQ